MKTLLVGEIHPVAEELLERNRDLRKISNQEFQESSQFPDVKTIVIRTHTKLDQKNLNKLPHLKEIISCSVGIDNIDLNELQRRKIELIHCPGSNANSVAEHTLYLIFNLLKNHRPIIELKNKTVGIIGLGYIGKLVAEKLKGFAVKIIAFDVVEQDQAFLEEQGIKMKSFDEVVQEADIITVHVPLNKHTENLINQDVFTKMKDNSFFINTSREEIINERDLIKNKEKFKGIALDVCSEKLKENLIHPNLVITNHMAALGEDSFQQMCLNPIKKYLAGLKEGNFAKPE